MNPPYHTALSPDEKASAGVTDPWAYALANKVLFTDLDALNHVNNAAYFSWFEGLRIRYFREYGISDFGPDAPRLVLRSACAEFKKELLLDAEYIVAGRTVCYRTTSLRMEYAIFSGGQIVTTGDAVVVLLKPDGSGRLALNAAQIETLTRRDGAIRENT